MAKTLIDVDLGLLDQAQRILGVRTKTAAVTEALRRVVAEAQFAHFMDYLTNLDEEQRAALDVARDQW